MHATFASPRFSPQCWRLHPSPPTRASSTSFRVSMVVLACRRLRPSPAAYLVPPVHLPVSLVVSPVPEPPRPTASHASLLPGQSLLSTPAPGPAGYHYHSQQYLLGSSFSSARMSQERRMRLRNEMCTVLHTPNCDVYLLIIGQYKGW